MDIWAPANASGSLPVLFWTHGGGFTGGAKSQNTPEGLVSNIHHWSYHDRDTHRIKFDLTTDFIFVSYNYRLGMTGLANGPTLLHQGGTSNFGLWDVEHALKWVHKYISNFGGNADAITAMGFSAGGSQTLFEMTRFAGHAEQLYAQAYVMSPGFVPGAGHEHAEAFNQNVSTAVDCDGGDLTCLRTVDTIVSNYTFQMQPRVDGDFVADTYVAQFLSESVQL